MKDLTIAEIAIKIREAPCEHLVRLVAVDGGAGAGKTTMAYRLAAELGAPVIQLDDFISFGDLEGWWPRFESQVLEPLFLGERVHYQIRDWVNDVHGDGLAGWKEVPWSPIVIIEGVGASRQAIADRLAFAIWVEVEATERLRRGIERDRDQPNIVEIWQRWQVMEAEFFARDKALERADLVVSGLGPHDFGLSSFIVELPT